MSTIINVTTNKNNYSIVEKDGKVTVTGGSFNETTENTLENVVNRFKVAMRLRGEEIVTWDEQMEKKQFGMRNTLNDVIALVENVIVTGKNRDWEKVVETVYLLKGDIYGFSGMVTESAWNNVCMKMLSILEVIQNYDLKMDNLSVDESYIVFLQKLMDGLKVLNEIKCKSVWC